MRKIAVIGVGNELLSDEGLGVHAARRLAAEPLPAGVEVLEAGTAGLGLLSFLDGRDAVLFLDVVLADGPPGAVYRFSGEELAGTAGPTAHGVGVAEVLGLARLTGVRPEVTVLAMVPADLETPSTELSPPVRERLEPFLALARAEIARLSGDPSPPEMLP